MPLPKNCCFTLFTTGYKRLTEGGWGVFALGFLLEAFAFGFGAFWLFDVGGFGREKNC
jgi:hypothetical protein